MDVGVDCTFAADGTVRVRRVLLHGRWQFMEQGRQWQDENGRHVLLMSSTGQVHEIVLHAQMLIWQIQTNFPTAPMAA